MGSARILESAKSLFSWYCADNTDAQGWREEIAVWSACPKHAYNDHTAHPLGGGGGDTMVDDVVCFVLFGGRFVWRPSWLTTYCMCQATFLRLFCPAVFHLRPFVRTLRYSWMTSCRATVMSLTKNPMMAIRTSTVGDNCGPRFTDHYCFPPPPLTVYYKCWKMVVGKFRRWPGLRLCSWQMDTF